MQIRILVFLLISNITIFAQSYVSSYGIPKDSSYTIYGYYQKEIKNFPFIKIVYPEHMPKVKEEYDLTYKTIGKRNLRIDIFHPNSIVKDLPIVLFIHGGGWRSGDKSFQHPLAIKVASRGYLCATVEYRLSPEAKYPAAVLDIKDAIKWLKENAAKYKGDTSKVVLVGCSSGGHLAALCGVTENVRKFNSVDSISKFTSKVQAIIDIDGILDFTHPAESGKDTSINYPSVGKLWLGETYNQNPALWIEASPLKYISKDSPSFLFLNSSNERFHAGRDEAIKILNNYNIYSEVYTYNNTPHTFWLFHPWFSQTVDHITNFLRKTFK
jgi:acetyl esterase/lipase